MSLEGEQQQNSAPVEKTEADMTSELEAKLADVLAAEESDEDQPEPQKQPRAADGKFVKADEAEGDGDEPAPEAEAEQPDDEGEADEQEDEKPAARIRLDTGDEVTLDELKAGYLKDADYRRKTQETAEERKSIRSEREFIRKAEAEAKEAMEFAVAVLSTMMPKRPTYEDAQTDPIGYMQSVAAYSEAQNTLSTIQQRLSKAGEGTKATDESERREALTREFEELGKKVPELAKPEAYQKFITRAAQSGADFYGFKPEEIAGITDHRLIVALKDAIAFREAQAKATKMAAKDQPAKPGIQPRKVMQPGAASHTNGKLDRRSLDTAFAKATRGDDAELARMLSAVL